MPLLLLFGGSGPGVPVAPFEGEMVFPGQLPMKWLTPGAPFAIPKWTFGGHTAKVIHDVGSPDLKWDMGRPRLVRRRPTT